MHIPKMEPSNFLWLLDELAQGQLELAMLVNLRAILRTGPVWQCWWPVIKTRIIRR